MPENKVYAEQDALLEKWSAELPKGKGLVAFIVDSESGHASHLYHDIRSDEMMEIASAIIARVVSEVNRSRDGK